MLGFSSTVVRVVAVASPCLRFGAALSSCDATRCAGRLCCLAGLWSDWSIEGLVSVRRSEPRGRPRAMLCVLLGCWLCEVMCASAVLLVAILLAAAQLSTGTRRVHRGYFVKALIFGYACVCSLHMQPQLCVSLHRDRLQLHWIGADGNPGLCCT